MGSQRDSTHEVFMRFEKCLGWRVSFLDMKNPQARFREFTFADPAKIEELIDRTSTSLILEVRQGFERGISSGTGAINLKLTDKQYRALLR